MLLMKFASIVNLSQPQIYLNRKFVSAARILLNRGMQMGTEAISDRIVTKNLKKMKNMGKKRLENLLFL